MNRPALKKLLKNYHVPANVMAHMVKVTALSMYLGHRLKDAGCRINLRLLRQAGLLHDVLKICDFKTPSGTADSQNPNLRRQKVWQKIKKQYAGLDHVSAGYALLISLGEYKIAEMIKKHRFSSVINEDPRERPLTWEEKILYYADKRVAHDKIVTLRERLDDLNKRYGQHALTKKSYENTNEIFRLEKEICRAATLDPQQITDGKIITAAEYLSVRKYLS